MNTLLIGCWARPRTTLGFRGMEWMIRKARAADTPAVLEMIRRTTFFRPDEEAIAHEVPSRPPPATAAAISRMSPSPADVCGWVCFGATPCTLGTFDVYWIAVDPDRQKPASAHGYWPLPSSESPSRVGGWWSSKPPKRPVSSDSPLYENGLSTCGVY